MGSGLLLYDALAGLHPAMPRHRHLTRRGCLRAVPALRDDSLTGGIRYFDAQVDDARFSLVLARTAASHGAVCASAVGVVDFRHEGERVAGVRAHDLESGGELDVRASTVINATGVWTTEMERLAGVANPMTVRPSKGVHIVVPRDRIDSEYALILRTEKSVLFVLPWADRWIIGTASITLRRRMPTSSTCSSTSTRRCGSLWDSTTSLPSSSACARCSAARPKRPRSCRVATPCGAALQGS
jgi:glycerol-3-phosphate dehydrogenase